MNRNKVDGRNGAKEKKQKIRVLIRFLFFCLLSSVFCLFLNACSNPIPKPYGYFRIETPEFQYENYSAYPNFSFEVSANAVIEPLVDTIKGEWFNINYTTLNAKIYCSYLPITPSQLDDALEDSRKFVYRHVMKADAITEQPFINQEYNIYGILYQLEGNVASPLQFVLTDSTTNFFRASLLFNNIPNQDSIAPVLDYIKTDVRQMLESFRWK